MSVIDDILKEGEILLEERIAMRFLIFDFRLKKPETLNFKL